ncbi:ribonuclease H-like domain-containing protein [Tanacetum coccineum]
MESSYSNVELSSSISLAIHAASHFSTIRVLDLLHVWPRYRLMGPRFSGLLVMLPELVLLIAVVTLSSLFFDRVLTDFSMIDLGSLNYFLGICVSRDDTESKLGVSVSDPTLYRSLAGTLQYLIFTRPDISYAVQHICLYMHDPREPQLVAFKWILRYVHGTLDYGLHIYSSSSGSLVSWTDAWAGFPTTRRSTSEYCVFLGNNLLYWSSKHHVTLSRSSAEVKYRGVTNVVAEIAWLGNILPELHSPLQSATLVYCDNVIPVYLSSNHVQQQHTKHIEIDMHFVRDPVAAGHVRMLHVPSRY